MRRLSLLPLAVLVIGLGVGPNVVAATDTGFDSRYFGESAFVTLVPGQSNQFAVGFTNTGRLGWQRNPTIVATPGHTPGHISVLFERDRVLVAGDALASTFRIAPSSPAVHVSIRLNPSRSRTA